MPKIIVVDDDKTSTALFEQVLLMNKYEVVTLNESARTVDTANEVKPDLIILDLMMPELDGFAVMDALQTQQDTADIPIIVATAKELTAAEKERMRGHIQSLMQKGTFSSDELIDEVRALLG